MSYKSRQKKRAVAASKRRYAHLIESRWYLTLVSRTTACARCGRVLREGAEMVYRYRPRESRCHHCALHELDSRGFHVSMRWEREHERRRRRR